MKYDLKKLPKSAVELTFTITPADYKKDLENAALRISERAAIKGFRPGKAPFDIVRQQVGEINILQEASEKIIQHAFFEAVKAEKLDTIGMPNVVIEKMAPGNDLVFKASVALLPTLELPDLAKIKIDRKKVEVGEKEVADVLGNLQRMQPVEEPKTGKATKEDKLVITMDMFLDKVPVEGGHADNHQVYLSEAHYIPGLAEQLIGVSKDETKEFQLRFPKDHYQKHLADKDIDFKVKVNEVFALKYPELNDEFAKTLGQESMAKLKELLTANLSREAERKEDQRVEEAILDALIEQSTFGEIPEVLVNSEKQKMFYELKHDLDRRGLSIEEYLMNTKKTEEALLADFTEQGTKRAKAALISRQVAKDNKITVDKQDLDAEISAIRKAYPGDTTVEQNLKKPEVLETIGATVQNRKVIQWLKEKVLEKKK